MPGLRDGYRESTRGLGIIDLVLSLLDGTTFSSCSALSNCKTAKDLLWLLGIGSPVTGLIQLLKWLKGRKPEKVEPLQAVDGSVGPVVQITAGPDSIVVGQIVYNLGSDPAVRDAARRLARPASTPGIKAIEFKVDDSSSSITREDASDISVPEEVVEEPEELLLPKSQRRAIVKPVKVWFEKGNRWQFSDGNNNFNADVADETFLGDLRQGTVQLGHNTELEVDLSWETFRSPKGLDTRYVVERVHRLREPGRQEMLFPRIGDEPKE